MKQSAKRTMILSGSAILLASPATASAHAGHDHEDEAEVQTTTHTEQTVANVAKNSETDPFLVVGGSVMLVGVVVLAVVLLGFRKSNGRKKK